MAVFSDAVEQELALFSTLFSDANLPDNVTAFPSLKRLSVDLRDASIEEGDPFTSDLKYILANITITSLHVASRTDAVFLTMALDWCELPSVTSLYVLFSQADEEEEDEEEDWDSEEDEDEWRRRSARNAEMRAARIVEQEAHETVPWDGDEDDIEAWDLVMHVFPMLAKLEVELYRRIKPHRHALLCKSTMAACPNLQVVWIHCSIPNFYVMDSGLWGARFRYDRRGDDWALGVCERRGVSQGQDWVELGRSTYHWYSGHH